LKGQGAVTDGPAQILGHFVHDGAPALVMRECEGWRSVWCGVPMLPGWLMRRIAVQAGVHAYTGHGCVVHRRGSLLSVYTPETIETTLATRAGERLIPIGPTGPNGAWSADPSSHPMTLINLSMRAGETRFFRVDAVA
jgi:hypothetical protein